MAGRTKIAVRRRTRAVSHPTPSTKKTHLSVGFFGGEGGMLSTLVLSVEMYRLDYQPFRLVPVSASSPSRDPPYGLGSRCAIKPRCLSASGSNQLQRQRKRPKWGVFFGGEGGIRTRGTVTRTHAFQACSFGQLGHLSQLLENIADIASGALDCCLQFP